MILHDPNTHPEGIKAGASSRETFPTLLITGFSYQSASGARGLKASVLNGLRRSPYHAHSHAFTCHDNMPSHVHDTHVFTCRRHTCHHMPWHACIHKPWYTCLHMSMTHMPSHAMTHMPSHVLMHVSSHGHDTHVFMCHDAHAFTCQEHMSSHAMMHMCSHGHDTYAFTCHDAHAFTWLWHTCLYMSWHTCLHMSSHVMTHVPSHGHGTCLHMSWHTCLHMAMNNTNLQEKIEPVVSPLCLWLHIFNSSQPWVKHIDNNWFSLPTMSIKDFQGWGKASRTIYFKAKSLSFAECSVHRNRVTCLRIISSLLNLSPHPTWNKRISMSKLSQIFSLTAFSQILRGGGSVVCLYWDEIYVAWY